jgi:hypothetical protein
MSYLEKQERTFYLTYPPAGYTINNSEKRRVTNRFALITRRSQVQVLPLLKKELNLWFGSFFCPQRDLKRKHGAYRSGTAALLDPTIGDGGENPAPTPGGLSRSSPGGS